MRNYKIKVYKVNRLYYICNEIKQKNELLNLGGKRMKGGMQGMLKQVQKMQAEMQKVQGELRNLTVSEEAGGGMIKATVNGSKELISVEIDPQVINQEEKEILEDLVVAAVNKALTSAGKMAEEEMAKVTKGMIPPGMNIPGL